ncbi:MAG: hypothetical protein H6833_06250 [Planctomycetes bacterium]|nr:hypothetical protein [Planctomycetota bacterium]
MPTVTASLTLWLTLATPTPDRFSNPDSAAAAARRALEMAARGVYEIEFEQQKRSPLQERIAQLEAELAKLVSDKAQALAEYRAGLYCSQCQCTPTEILPEDFQEHLRRVQGTAIRPSEEAIQEKARQFDQAIESKRRELERARSERSQSSRREGQARGQVVEAYRSFQEADWWYARLQQEQAWRDGMEADRLRSLRIDAERAERTAMEGAQRLEAAFRELASNPNETLDDLERRVRAGSEWQAARLAWERARIDRWGAFERERRHGETMRDRANAWDGERVASGQRMTDLLERATGSRVPPLGGLFIAPWVPGPTPLGATSRDISGSTAAVPSPSSFAPLQGLGQRANTYADRFAGWFEGACDSLRSTFDDATRSIGDSLLDQALGHGQLPSVRRGIATSWSRASAMRGRTPPARSDAAFWMDAPSPSPSA